jgi:hypothetical protein
VVREVPEAGEVVSEPTFDTMTAEEVDEAIKIVADLAHAGGPCPCPSLTFNSRQRAERLMQRFWERRRKEKRRTG